ncbi:MAG: hypothetical protein GF317_24005 [Candidatus Lokiarchaeota archaeon]|nr:hypothetical protein [Candidatus Lokiarchaeota archaeon]MBD3202438.1 hypothetical protein [Candidatus Lokiarchaeota archaeon]
MKFWLFDILSCPICKKYPLKLFIFSYENDEKDFDRILEYYHNDQEMGDLIQRELVIIEEINEKIYIKDNIVIKETPGNKYLQKIIESIEELNYVQDKSKLEISKELIDIIKKQVKNKIQNFQRNKNKDKLSFNQILKELHLVNILKIELEINEGLLYCDKCQRWFPIISTIPQLLPDEYREKEKDKEFFQTNKNLLDEKFLKQDLKPYDF